MNNAKYVRVAELARWRIFPRTGVLDYVSNKGVLFLAVDQRIQYFKPIKPFQKYVVQTKINYNPVDDKWLYYTHTFLQHPSEIKDKQTQIKFAEVTLKVISPLSILID
jgi:acyl-CoA thioesterase FadM